MLRLLIILTMITNLGKVSARSPIVSLGSAAMVAAVANTVLTKDLA